MFRVGNAAVGILWRIGGMKQNRLSTWVKIQVEEMEQEFQPLIASNLTFTDVISGSWRNRPLLGPHGRQKCLKTNPVDQGLTKLP